MEFVMKSIVKLPWAMDGEISFDKWSDDLKFEQHCESHEDSRK
jgi:hypothetical protein